MKECKHCESEFNPNTALKRAVGGKINECPDCVEALGTETAPATVGVMSGEGKVGMMTVLRFDNQAKADAYVKAWKHSTGYNKGKSCQIGRGLTGVPNVKFSTVTTNNPNANHKGKA